MAKQVINIGTTANDGTGDPLRSAFDKVNDNFTELYTDDAGDVSSITATAPIARDSATGAVTISLNDSGVTTLKLADDAVTADKLANSINSEIAANTSKVTNATHTGDVTGSTALTIADDTITSPKVGTEFTTTSAVGSSATENIDWTSAQIFTLTPSQSTTLNVTNPVIGISKSFVITGSGNSYTITLNVGGAAGTFNLISGEYDDTSAKKNLYSVLCVSATEFWVSISQIG